MSSSRNKNILLSIYSDTRNVFTLADIAMLVDETTFNSLNNKLNYYVRKGQLFRPRKGIYTKPNYSPEELSCVLYTPSYLSLEYVLQKAGVIFQYDNRLTSVGYLNRTVEIENCTYSYRKVKSEILIDTQGITQTKNINIATPERAFLDLLYLDKEYYFDNLNILDKKIILNLLPLYRSKALAVRVKKILQNND